MWDRPREKNADQGERKAVAEARGEQGGGVFDDVKIVSKKGKKGRKRAGGGKIERSRTDIAG